MKQKDLEKFLLYLRIMEHLQLDPTESINHDELMLRADEALTKFRKKYPVEAGYPEVSKEEQYVVSSHIFAKIITANELEELAKRAKSALEDGIIQKRHSAKEWELDKEFSEKDYLDFINKK